MSQNIQNAQTTTSDPVLLFVQNDEKQKTLLTFSVLYDMMYSQHKLKNSSSRCKRGALRTFYRCKWHEALLPFENGSLKKGGLNMFKNSICWVCRKGQTPYLSHRHLYKARGDHDIWAWFHGKHLVVVANGKRWCK